MSGTNTEKSPEIQLDWGKDQRTDILFWSLMMEYMVSAQLGRIVGITEHENSRTFSFKSTALSFNQKMDMLLDLGAFSKDERSKFQLFMEIRNQFMHNIAADKYEKCFALLNGREKFLMKFYPKDGATKEENLMLAVRDLTNELFLLMSSLFEHITLLKGPIEEIEKYFADFKERRISGQTDT